MDGCSFVDPPPRDEQALRGWLGLAVALLNTLPPKLSKSKPRRIKVKREPDYALPSAIKSWYKTGTHGCFCGF